MRHKQSASNPPPSLVSVPQTVLYPAAAGNTEAGLRFRALDGGPGAFPAAGGAELDPDLRRDQSSGSERTGVLTQGPDT